MGYPSDSPYGLQTSPAAHFTSDCRTERALVRPVEAGGPWTVRLLGFGFLTLSGATVAEVPRVVGASSPNMSVRRWTGLPFTQGINASDHQSFASCACPSGQINNDLDSNQA